MHIKKKTMVSALIMALSLNGGCAAFASGDAMVAPKDAQVWHVLEADLHREAQRQTIAGRFSKDKGMVERPLTDEEQALAHLMEAEADKHGLRAGAMPLPVPARPLTADEKIVMRRLILAAASVAERESHSVRIRVADAETGKPIPNALVVGEFHDAGFGGSSHTRYEKYAVGADGVFNAVTDAEVFQVKAPGYDTEEVLPGGSPFGRGAVSLEMLQKSPPSQDVLAYLMAANVTNPKAEQAAKAWRAFVFGKEVQLVKSADKTELDVRRVKLVAKKAEGAAVMLPTLGFSYRPEDRDLKRHPLSAVEICEMDTGPCQPPLLSDKQKREVEQLTRQERRLPDDLPDALVKELDDLGLDVKALCRVHAVIMLCETDKEGEIAMVQVGPVWKYVGPKQRGEYPAEDQKLYDQEYKKRTRYYEVEYPRLEKLERCPKPGLYPTKIRLIALGQSDGFIAKPDLRTNGYRCPSIEKQMRRAPETGYQKEWVLTAEDLAVANYGDGRNQFKTAYVRLNGKYGRMKMSGVKSLDERMSWEAEIKKRDDKKWVEEQLKRSSGVREDRKEVELNLEIVMQPNGSRNLHTVAYFF